MFTTRKDVEDNKDDGNSHFTEENKDAASLEDTE